MSERRTAIWNGLLLWAIGGLWMLTPTLGLGAAPDEQAPAATIRMVIDYGDGVEKHFSKLEWRAGMTIADALRLAANHPHGIRWESRGSGATLFVTSIDDLKNEGRGKNWVYRLNGKLGESSCAEQVLKEKDSVLWKFEVYR